MGYGRFVSTIFISTVVMFFLMYSEISEITHFVFSRDMLLMALLMSSSMAIIMLCMMKNMYTKKNINILLYLGSMLIFLITFFLIRSQYRSTDISYMKSMIPHHSMAILMSQQAQIKDPRVRKLAERILATQSKEINEMKLLIENLKNPSLNSK